MVSNVVVAVPAWTTPHPSTSATVKKAGLVETRTAATDDMKKIINKINCNCNCNYVYLHRWTIYWPRLVQGRVVCVGWVFALPEQDWETVQTWGVETDSQMARSGVQFMHFESSRDVKLRIGNGHLKTKTTQYRRTTARGLVSCCPAGR